MIRCEVCNSLDDVRVVDNEYGPWSDIICRDCLYWGLIPYNSLILMYLMQNREDLELGHIVLPFNLRYEETLIFYNKKYKEFVEDAKQKLKEIKVRGVKNASRQVL